MPADVDNIPLGIFSDSLNQQVRDKVSCQIAGFDIVFDLALPALLPFASSSSKRGWHECNQLLTVPDETRGYQKKKVSGWLANRELQISIKAGKRDYFLSTDKLGRYHVDDRRILCLNGKICHQEMILGPCFALMSALHSVFLMHGSAVYDGQGCTLFVGRSGAGKSTLAEFLNHRSDSEHRRLCDDIIPLEVSQTGAWVRPHFPQLKLDATKQCTQPDLVKCRVHQIVVIREPAVAETKLNIIRASKIDAALACIRHSVAAKLFDPILHARHLDFTSTLVKNVPVYFLDYPKTQDSLEKVSSLVFAR
jgi:hypothetical protein